MEDCGCPALLIPVSRGQVSIVIYSINLSGPLQSLGFGAVMCRVCKTFTHNGVLGTLRFMLYVFGITFIILCVIRKTLGIIFFDFAFERKV